MWRLWRVVLATAGETYLLTCSWWWWAQQQKLTRAHIWPVFIESVLEWIRWLRFDHVLWQWVPTITDSDTEECFPDGFGTSWDVNFHRMFSEVVYFWSHLEYFWKYWKGVAIVTMSTVVSAVVVSTVTQNESTPSSCSIQQLCWAWFSGYFYYPYY